MRVDVRVGVRIDVRYRARGACSAAHIIFKLLSELVGPGRVTRWRADWFVGLDR